MILSRKRLDLIERVPINLHFLDDDRYLIKGDLTYAAYMELPNCSGDDPIAQSNRQAIEQDDSEFSGNTCVERGTFYAPLWGKFFRKTLAYLDRLDAYAVLDEGLLSEFEMADYYEAWENHGRGEFLDSLPPLARSLFDDTSYDDLLTLYEQSHPSGEYYHYDYDGTIYINGKVSPDAGLLRSHINAALLLAEDLPPDLELDNPTFVFYSDFVSPALVVACASLVPNDALEDAQSPWLQDLAVGDHVWEQLRDAARSHCQLEINSSDARLNTIAATALEIYRLLLGVA